VDEPANPNCVRRSLCAAIAYAHGAKVVETISV